MMIFAHSYLVIFMFTISNENIVLWYEIEREINYEL